MILGAGHWMLQSGTGLLAFAFLTGFNYGGILVLYASSAARIWGSERVGPVYGLLFSANIFAAISPVLAGFCYDILGAFTIPVFALSVLMLSATFLVRKGGAAQFHAG